ncbi:glycosyltransferase family 4 protein [Massilia forsythiae]|uniref:Glycosyltransferase family 4 protein n=1 Tax=Massilia forsythiae TaxID=2728020 RepID=A0A7Z2ZUB8_9BURK|nr:glycosyltransferase family 4 protein [Massilia forsythiae]QJE00897.1 glycosyltransferase family 4 protein [Massilia forsythiae]
MHLLIVNLHLDIGGVETLLVRLIPQLAQRGVSVTLMLLQRKVNQEFLESLQPYCQIKFIRDAFPFTRKHLRDFFGSQPDVAYFTINQAFVFGSWLLKRAGYKTKTVLGAYQTEIFCAPAKPWQYHRKIVQNAIRKNIPAQSVIFGNTAGRDYHASRLMTNLDDSPIVRLFVDVEKYKFIRRGPLLRRKIVSIGRISPYKTYNFTVLDIIKNLTEIGHHLEWDIYGDGENFGELQETIIEKNLEKYVHLHGTMSYSRFQEVLDDAFLFIGSGTSLIEASACGVPSLTTIEYSNEALSYGFISEIEGFNLIEPSLDKRIFSIEEKILEILNASVSEYEQLQDQCYLKAISYSGSSVVDEYIAVFEASKINGVVTRITDSQILGYVMSAAIGYMSRKIGIRH